MPQTIVPPVSSGNNFILRLQAHPVCKRINAFFLTPFYFLLLCALTVISSVFSAELVVYTCFILIAVYISFCGKDYLPLVPIVVCSYIAPSVGNNPGKNPNSIFFPESGGIYLLCLAGLFVISLILRLCLDPQIGRKAFFVGKRKLMTGMLILGGGYLLAGAFSGHYFDKGMSNLVFALLQFIAVFLLYYIFCGVIKWDEVPKDYLAWTGLCIGFSILFQLAHIYVAHNVIVDGEIQRIRIYSGWGIYNNMGALLAMMIPFAFQMACLHKRSWIYHLCALAFLAGVLLTCSRSAILVSLVIYALSYGVLIYKDLHTKKGILLDVIVAVAIAAAFLLFHDELYHLFRELLDRGFTPSNRFEVYEEGIKQFLKHPIFGGSFYPTDYDLFDFSEVAAFSSFFPPRWHNTIVQLLASCGVVGLLAYGYHRVDTARMLWKNRTVGTALIALSILALLGTSMLDCHFFNVGPTLFYSMILAFAEKADTRQDNW